MEKTELKDAFSEFKDLKNIDRATMMGVLEDVFRTQLAKTYGSADNFDIIINIDKGARSTGTAKSWTRSRIRTPRSPSPK